MGPKLLSKHGFETVGQAPPSFELMAKQFEKGSLPSFSNDCGKRMHQFGKGLTVIRSDQCPYLEDATNVARKTANEMSIQSQGIPDSE